MEAGESIYEHTWEFHWELARIAGNSVLAKLLEVLYSMIRELQITYYEPFIDSRQEVVSHRTFLEQMRSATPEAARQLICEHLNQVNSIMLQAMQRSYQG